MKEALPALGTGSSAGHGRGEEEDEELDVVQDEQAHRPSCPWCVQCLDPNVKGRQLKTISNQNVCSYHDYIQKTISVPGCPVHVNPLYTYPVALSCKCDKCNTEYTDCVQDRIGSNYCTKPREPKYLLYKFLQ
ncbi:thyrotropin subunit beta isoform X5 [Ranitomeya imitator]|uniref:thyrotropin subunit beta isoform X5 n=1 Tax=Ranitomeya imitator TaxID=111125 RepID=UPI0037E76D7A